MFFIPGSDPFYPVILPAFVPTYTMVSIKNAIVAITKSSTTNPLSFLFFV